MNIARSTNSIAFSAAKSIAKSICLNDLMFAENGPLERLPAWDLFYGRPPSPTLYHHDTGLLQITKPVPSDKMYAFMNTARGLVTDIDVRCVVLYEGNSINYESYFMSKGSDSNNFVGVTSYNSKIMLYEKYNGIWHNLNVNIPVAGTAGKRIRFTTVGDQVSLYVADPGSPEDDGLIGTATSNAPLAGYIGILLRGHPITGDFLKDWEASGVPASRTVFFRGDIVYFNSKIVTYNKKT